VNIRVLLAGWREREGKDVLGLLYKASIPVVMYSGMQVKLRSYNSQQWAQVRCLRGFVIKSKGYIGAHTRMSLGRESASGRSTREPGSDIYIYIYMIG
jgi:hypothetical protein